MLFLFISLLLISFSSQKLLLGFAFLVLFFLKEVFTKIQAPKVIFIGLAYFWITITIKIFYADFLGVSYENLSTSPKIVETTYLALLGLLVMSGGIFFLIKNIEKPNIIDALRVYTYDTKKVIIFYIFFSIIAGYFNSHLFAFGSLSQLLYAFVVMKQGFLFFLIHVAYTQNERFKQVILVIIIEILLSFVSYFSSFKDILITVIVVFSFYPIKFSITQAIRNTFLLVGTLYLMIIWQTIKGDYRTYLNKGTTTQSIQVSQVDALKQIWVLASNADPFAEHSEVFKESIDRLSYIEFFSQATVKVPEFLPHELGDIWANNIMHILIPRFLNPNKKAIYDSDMVNKYCITQVAGASEGTSFSLGFLAESYIDFGYIFMFVPVFLVGCFIGLIYKVLVTKSINLIWGYSMVSSLWVFINCNGTPGTKILGWLTMHLIMFYIIRKLLMVKVDRYLRK